MARFLFYDIFETNFSGIKQNLERNKELGRHCLRTSLRAWKTTHHYLKYIVSVRGTCYTICWITFLLRALQVWIVVREKEPCKDLIYCLAKCFGHIFDVERTTFITTFSHNRLINSFIKISFGKSVISHKAKAVVSPWWTVALFTEKWALASAIQVFVHRGQEMTVGFFKTHIGNQTFLCVLLMITFPWWKIL